MSKRKKRKQSVAASQPEAETVKAADQAAPAAENWSEELLDARLEEALRQAMGNAAPTPGQPERGQKPAPEKERVRKAQSQPTQAQPRRTETAEAKSAAVRRLRLKRRIQYSSRQTPWWQRSR